jgi:hypothetical protein
MKLSAEVVKIAMQIQKELEKERESLKSFEKSFGSKYTDPELYRVDVAFRYIHKDSAMILGKKYDQVVTSWRGLDLKK